MVTLVTNASTLRGKRAHVMQEGARQVRPYPGCFPKGWGPNYDGLSMVRSLARIS